MLEQFARRVTACFSRHPSDGVLLSLQDGELSGKRRGRVRSHLEGCSRCRTRATRIEQEWKRIAELGSAAYTGAALAEEEIISGIRTSIRAWNSPNLVQWPPQEGQDISRQEAEHRMVAVLAVYLGQHAAGALLHGSGTTPPPWKESLASTDSTLTALIGRKDATAIEARLIRILNHVLNSAAGSSFS